MGLAASLYRKILSSKLVRQKIGFLSLSFSSKFSFADCNLNGTAQRRSTLRHHSSSSTLPTTENVLRNRLNYLAYCTAKNLAFVYNSQNKPDLALRQYLRTLLWCEEDVATWISLGRMAVQTKKWWLARHAFEKALQVDWNERGPNVLPHRIPLSHLCEVLFVIGDITACRYHLQLLLQVSPGHSRASSMLSSLNEEERTSLTFDTIQCDNEDDNIRDLIELQVFH
jgi:tetratricopeptide (TPR) repeat protein